MNAFHINWNIFVLQFEILYSCALKSARQIKIFPLISFFFFFLAFSGFIDRIAKECDRKQGKRGGVTRSKGTRESSPGSLQSLGPWVARATNRAAPLISLTLK